MGPVLFAAALLGGFTAGVLAHKYVLSEAEKIKKHVTDEVAELRADLAELKEKIKAGL